jgi:pimeloyl-ACP methyl ester carboxylesterase
MAVEALPAELARELPHVPGVRHRLVDVRGVRIHVAEAGEGEPVILQHGWPQHWYAWRHVIPELARTRRVIAPDLRGFGWSEAPPGDYEKETLAADLIGLLDALELDRVDLIGHDWGGFTGFIACLHAPDRFRRFLALAIPHPWIQPDPVGLLKRLPFISYQFIVATPLLGELVLMASPAPMELLINGGSGGRIDADAVRSYATRLQQRSRARATSALYRTFLLRELPAILQGRYADRRLTVPTRLLIGGEDPVVTLEAAAGYEDHADDMEVRELAGVGHFIPDEAPAEVLEQARSFLGEPVAAPANGATAPVPEAAAPPAPPAPPEPEPPIEIYLHPERVHVEEGLEEVAESADPEAGVGAHADLHVAEPWEGYDEMTVPDIRERLRAASPELAALVRLYEETHKNRAGVLRAIDAA